MPWYAALKVDIILDEAKELKTWTSKKSKTHNTNIKASIVTINYWFVSKILSSK